VFLGFLGYISGGMDAACAGFLGAKTLLFWDIFIRNRLSILFYSKANSYAQQFFFKLKKCSRYAKRPFFIIFPPYYI
jgi:hypothetical protein